MSLSLSVQNEIDTGNTEIVNANMWFFRVNAFLDFTFASGKSSHIRVEIGIIMEIFNFEEEMQNLMKFYYESCEE